MNKIKRELIKYRKGIIVGVSTGVLFALYTKIKGIDLMFAMQGRSGLDIALPTIPIETMAFLKVLLILIILGATIGFIIENIIERWSK